MSESSSTPTYALVLAGGSGQRFWPLSRDSHPKQLLDLFDTGTLLSQTIARLEDLVPKENILVLTNRDQFEAVRDCLPEIPEENIIAEPEKRDTAPAVALGIGWVAARDPSANMMVLPADQLIHDREAYNELMGFAVETAELSNSLVTIGIKPTWACPSYGYIQRGRRATISGLSNRHPVFEVERFREKPNPDLAESFITEGCFSWNAGIFIWSVPVVMSELAQHCPELAKFVSEIRKSRDIAATIASQFASLPKISIDYALMERATRVLNIEGTFDWDDVGSWISVGKYLKKDAGSNASNTELTQLEAHDNIVYNSTDRHIALLGVKDLIVVQTDDALLIAERSDAERIKRLVELLPKELL